MSKEIECPWCGKTVTPKATTEKRKLAKVIERKCPDCGKVISAYNADEKFLDIIRERVLNFKD